MPYGKRRVVGVKLAQIPGLVYGFRTDVDAEKTSKVLGHLDGLNANGTFIPGLVFGINSPKPPKAKKFFGTGDKGYESSFVDKDKIDDARKAGWIVTPGNISKLRSTKYSKLVYIDYKVQDEVLAAEGVEPAAAIAIKYGWRMPAYQYAKLSAPDRTGLGIKDFTPDDATTIVMGANDPKPNRVSKTVVTGDVSSTLTTYVASAKEDSLPAGWVAL